VCVQLRLEPLNVDLRGRQLEADLLELQRCAALDLLPRPGQVAAVFFRFFLIEQLALGLLELLARLGKLPLVFL